MRNCGYHVCGIGTLLLSVIGKILHLVMYPISQAHIIKWEA